MDRASAGKMTLLAQTGLGVGALALGGVIFAGVKVQPPADPASEIVVPDVKMPEGASPGSKTPAVRVDSGGTASRFARVGNSPKPVVVPAAETQPQVQPVVQESLTYHGLANIGAKPLGLVRVNGKQKFVSLGAVVSGDEKAIEIDAAFIRVGAAEPGRRIDLAARAGGSVTLGTVSSTPQVAMDPSDQMRERQMEMMRRGLKPSMFSGQPGRVAKDVPEYIADDDIVLFRKVRAKVLADSQYAGQGDPNEIATKLMEQDRQEMQDRAAKGLPVEMSPEEQQLESKHLILRQGGSPK